MVTDTKTLIKTNESKNHLTFLEISTQKCDQTPGKWNKQRNVVSKTNGEMMHGTYSFWKFPCGSISACWRIICASASGLFGFAGAARATAHTQARTTRNFMLLFHLWLGEELVECDAVWLPTLAIYTKNGSRAVYFFLANKFRMASEMFVSGRNDVFVLMRRPLLGVCDQYVSNMCARIWAKKTTSSFEMIIELIIPDIQYGQMIQ